MNSKLINLDFYPLDQPDSTRYKEIVAKYRAQLMRDEFVNMEGFLTEYGTTAIAREIDDRTDQTFHSARMANPYGKSPGDSCNPQNSDDTDQRAIHPAEIYARTDRYGLARHQLQNTLLDSIYCWEPVKHFVRDILGLSQIYLHEDPSNALVVQMYKHGGGLAWHFDRALFSTILNIRESDKGGVFECAPGLRSELEPRYDNVRDVLLEQSSLVKRHHVKSGSFTIMRGRYTMHRVTENLGSTSRLSAVLSYEDKPGVKLDLATRRTFFGASAPDD